MGKLEEMGSKINEATKDIIGNIYYDYMDQYSDGAVKVYENIDEKIDKLLIADKDSIGFIYDMVTLGFSRCDDMFCKLYEILTERKGSFEILDEFVGLYKDKLHREKIENFLLTTDDKDEEEQKKIISYLDKKGIVFE